MYKVILVSILYSLNLFAQNESVTKCDRLLKAISQDQRIYNISTSKGDKAFKEGKYNEAIELFEKAIDYDHKSQAYPYSRIAVVYERMKKFKKAQEYFKMALDLMPLSERHLESNVKILIKLEKHAEALEVSDRLVAINPSHLRVFSYRAQALYHMGEVRRAHENMLMAIELDPKNVINLSFHAKIYLKLNDPMMALRSLDLAIQYKKNDPVSLTAKADVLLQLGKLDKALYYVQTAMGIKRDDFITRDTYTQIMIAKGQLDVALNFVKGTLEKSPNRLRSLELKSAILLGLNKSNESKKAVNKIYKETRNRNFVGSIMRIKIFLQVEDKMEAYDLVTKELEIMPENSRLKGLLGRIFVELGDYERALKVAADLGASTESKLESHVVRMLVYKNMGKTELYKLELERLNDLKQKEPFWKIFDILGVKLYLEIFNS